MNVRKAFKFKLMLNGEQIRKVKQFCGCARFVFNKALGWQNEQYQADNTCKFHYTTLANLLPSWKKEYAWLGECHSQVLQQSLRLRKPFCANNADSRQMPMKSERLTH